MTRTVVDDESAPLHADDQPFFDAVKAEYGDRCAAELAIRIARAFRHAPKKTRMQVTLAEAKRIIEWREALQVDTIVNRPLERAKRLFECWPGYIYGEDRDGHLVTAFRIADINIDGLQHDFAGVDELLPHRAQYMERVQWESAAISRRLGRRVYKHICVVDLKGLSMRHLSPSLLHSLKPFFDVGQHYYPESLLRVYLVNVPFIFFGAWKLITTLIDPVTCDKIQVIKDSSKFLAVAKTHGISPDALPAFAGGSHPGKPVDDSFRPSVADTPPPGLGDCFDKVDTPSVNPVEEMKSVN